MQREISRWWESFQRRKEKVAPVGASEPLFAPRWSWLRWWFLPIFVGCVGGWAAWELWSTSQMAGSSHALVILDAPLPSATKPRPWSDRTGRYFVLQPQGETSQVLLSQPGRGMRAYRGQEGVPLLSEKTTLAELFLPPCKSSPSADATFLYTGDGLILWLCQQDHERIALYRVGWRFSMAQWRSGRKLGYSATNDIVLGGAMLPLYSAHLRIEGHQLHIEPRDTCLTSPVDANNETDTLQPQEEPRDKEPKEPAEDSIEMSTLCSTKPQKIAAGALFRLHSSRFPHRAVTMRWTPSLQSREGADLWLVPVTGEGSSSRLLSLEALRLARHRDFLVGRADLYFQDVLPDTARTLDLEETVHKMVLRGSLRYLEGDTLRKRLDRSPFSTIAADAWLDGAMLRQERHLLA
ncbi:MAG: hypothetical protein H6727_16560, partial [Myxococcales bacterium]|nr:hypothetical protein [Myxococcales bacterium]